jgi:hypothetical protein
MKQEILKILNLELMKADDGLEIAIRNQDYTSKMIWLRYSELINKLKRKVQDET